MHAVAWRVPCMSQATDDSHRHRYDWALEALETGYRQRKMIIDDDSDERFWHPGHLRSHWPGRARVARLLFHLACRSAREGDGATARMIVLQPRRCWLVLSLVRAQSTVSDESMLSILRGSWIAGDAAVRKTATHRGKYLTWASQLRLQKVYERTRPDIVLQCGDKLLLSRFLQTRGVPTPRTFELHYGHWQPCVVRIPDAVQPGGQFEVAAPFGPMLVACPPMSKPGEHVEVMVPGSGPEELPRCSLFVKPCFLDGGRGVKAYEWRDNGEDGRGEGGSAGGGDRGGDCGGGDRGPGGGGGGGAYVDESSGEVVAHDELWQRLAPPSSSGLLLVQERLRNAACVRALVGDGAAVCTFRVVSVQPVKLPDARAIGRASVVSCAMRMPSDARVLADNYSSGGVFCSVDWRAEKLVGPARDLRGALHTHHPNTGAPIDGHQLPGSREAIEGCAALHQLVCEEYFADAYPWLAWDVSLTTGDAGFHVLEVNPICGPGFQLVCGPWLVHPTVRRVFDQVPRWRLRRDRGDSVVRSTPKRRAELQRRKACETSSARQSSAT